MNIRKIFSVFLAMPLCLFAAESDHEANDQQLEEIIVNTNRTEIDLTIIDPETERLLGIAGAGEDPLQAILSLPGVTFSSDGEPVIRGSAPGDNSYYIDFIPASDIYHLYGNSIFNKYVIQDFDLYPAAFSSQYGNATGGVIDVSLREPASIPFTTTFSASFLQTALMFESKITENQAFYLTARTSLIDKIIKEESVNEEEEEEGVLFSELPASTDYQAKYLWTMNGQNKLSFVAAGSSDRTAFELTDDNNDVLVDPDLAGPIDYDKSFDSQGLIWSWQSRDLSKNLNSIVTHIDEKADLFYGGDQFFKVDTDTTAVRFDYTQYLSDSNQIKLGLINEASKHDIDANLKFVNCSDFDADCPTVDVEIVSYQNKLSVNRTTTYVEDSFQIGDSQRVTTGLHYSKDDYLKDSRVEPRLRWDYDFKQGWSTYLAVGQYSQLPDLGDILDEVGNPNLETIKADHFVWGIENQLANGWNWKADLYYKKLSDVVIAITDPNDPDYDLNYSNEAEGSAYGAELLINKDLSNKWDGWLALSLGRAERTDLKSGLTTPFEYDRPVMLDLVVNYKPSENWTMGIKWNYQTGDRYTPIIDVAKNVNNPSVLEPIYGSLILKQLRTITV